MLGKYLINESFDIDEEEDYIPIKIEGDTLTINNSNKSIVIHKKGKDNFIREISYKKLFKIIRVLSIIEEQPIVLCFDTFISINEIDF